MSNFEIKQYIHRPNNTELGLGNTNDSYLLIASDCPLQDEFSIESSKDIVFTDSQDGRDVILRFLALSKNSDEHRLTKFGDYKRKYDLRYGDEIRLEKIIQDDSDIFYSISCVKRKCLIISKSRGLYEVINTHYCNNFRGTPTHEINIFYNNNPSILTITFAKSGKKRRDSPKETDFYDVLINGRQLEDLNNCILDLDTNILSKINKWEYHELKYSENE